MNLLKAMQSIAEQSEQIKRETKEKIDELTKQANEKLAELRIAYDQLARLNTACNMCDGTGKIWEDDGHEYEGRIHKAICPKCNGTGHSYDGGHLNV